MRGAGGAPQRLPLGGEGPAEAPRCLLAPGARRAVMGTEASTWDASCLVYLFVVIE